jgi:hypothetical protein
MPTPTPLRLLTAALLAAAIAAAPAADAPSLSEQVNQVAQKFEAQQDHDFKGVAESLDRWRYAKHRAAVKEITDLFAKAASADKAFIAYHLLSVDPKNAQAQALFKSAGTPAPIDETGQRVPGVAAPTCSNRQLVEKVSNLKYPPFSEVAEVVSRKSPTVQSYWKRQASGLDDLRKQLIALADKGEPASAYQALAYYWPGCKEVTGHYSTTGKPVPRQRTWFPSVDRYLLDHELAGIDCLDTRIFKPSSGPEPVLGEKGAGATLNGTSSWDFMENLRNCRIEGMLSVRGEAVLAIVDGSGRGAALTLAGKRLEIGKRDGGKPEMLKDATLDQDLGGTPTPIQLEVRGRTVSALVGGVLVASADLPADFAYKRATITSTNLVAQQLRVRFLADKIETPLELLASGDAPKPPAVAKQPDEPWRAERLKQLDKAVSFKFDDTPVEEAVAALSQLTGMKFAFDSKAETLKNLPVTLSGKDMKLGSALDWLQRVTDLSYVPTADGVTLTWNK